MSRPSLLAAATTLVAAVALTATPAHADDVTVAPIPALSGSYGGFDPVGIDIDASGGRWIVSNNTIRYFPKGSVTAARTISGPATGISFVLDVAVDVDGAIHVLDTGNDAIRVFAPGANGNVAPARVIVGANTQMSYPASIDVDSAGFIHVADATADALLTFAPSASGNDFPIHRISGDRTQLDSVGSVERRGSLLWATSIEADAVIAFPYGAEGNLGPVRVIGGSRSGLASPRHLTLDDAGNIYVVNGSSSRHVMVFAAAADGNATPLKVVTVAGRTQAPSGLAVDPRRLLHLPNISFSTTDVLPAVITAVPSAPRGPVVSGSTKASKRTATWAAPAADGFTPITRYEVIVKAGSRTVYRTTTVASKRSFVMTRTKLGKGTRTLMVRAQNAKGYSGFVKKTFVVK